MQETENTLLARERLSKFTDKPITITTVQEIAKQSGIKGIEGYFGATYEHADHIEVALNPNHPDSLETSFVHELLHIMLDHEGFPSVTINKTYATAHVPQQLWPGLPKLQSYFSSVLQHPEVYRRMRNEYTLDMEAYFGSLVTQKTNRFKKASTTDQQQLLFLHQQDILDGLEYFYYNDEHRAQILGLFKSKSPSAYQSCLGLHRSIEKIGMHTPQSCHKSAEAIKSRLIKHGAKRGLLPVFNSQWHAIQIS